MERREILLTQERIISRDPVHAYEQVRRRIRRRQRRIWIGRACMAAACMALGYGLFWFSHPEQGLTGSAAQLITVESKPGMRTSFRLPDSTLVYLNSGSILKYPIPFDDKERRLQLSGEAYFKVSHNPELPFLVDVLNNELTIKVLGTEFNVEAYCEDEIINTTLVQGSLLIIADARAGESPTQVLVPSERATYFRAGRQMDVKVVDMACDTGWLDGKIILKDTPLPEMLRKLTHYYNVDFIVSDPVLESYSFTGVFDDRQLSQVLDYLKISSGINFRITLPLKDDSESINRRKVYLSKEAVRHGRQQQ